MPVSSTIPGTPRAASRRRDSLDQALDADLFRALADPTRCRIFACLVKCPRPCSVTEVAECCAVDFSVVSRHLAALAKAGLLTAEKRGRTAFYAARHREIADRFRGIAGAIDKWASACDPAHSLAEGACCSATCCPPSSKEDTAP